MYKKILRPAVPYTIVFLLLLAGCATTEGPTTYGPGTAELMDGYPPSSRPLALQRITALSNAVLPRPSSKQEVVVMVHPAYAVYFRDGVKNKEDASIGKYSLIKRQFENEARAIANVAATGRIMVLVVPGGYPEDSRAPQSYETYLNAVTSGGGSVYYVLSETSNNGTLPLNDMVSLYQFLQAMNVEKVLIGGGFIGRCQREFYNQLTTYIDKSIAFIVPELSSISPDDVTEEEALQIEQSIGQQDFAPVNAFIEKRTGGQANILSVPLKADK